MPEIEITDEYMYEQLGKTRQYSAVILQAGERYGTEGADAIIREHGRRNFQLRAAGKLAIVCPVLDDSDVCGIGIFTGTVEETEAIMREDPGVKAGVFTFGVHPVRSFPGDSLPA
jgi:hypothetical protein